MIDPNAYRERLLSRRDELVKRLNQLEDWLDDPMAPNFEDRATERELDEVFELQGLAGQDELKAIDAALARIKNNVFGEMISEARLEAVPYAVKCQNCMA